MKARSKFKSQSLMWVGLAFITLIILMGVFAPLLTDHNPLDISLENRFTAPSWEHPFGRDENGSDVFAKVAYGARVSLLVAITVVFVSALIGTIIGSVAGYTGGKVDNFIMRVIDMVYAFPGFLLALALVAMLGPSVANVILAMCLTTWAGFARMVRGEVLHLKERDYVQSARSMGANHTRIVVLHVWPNLVGILVVQMTLAMAGTIITESGLSFLGLGAPPTVPTWGALLNSGRQILFEAPHVSLFPGIAIVVLVLGFNLFGDGLRDYLDPHKN